MGDPRVSRFLQLGLQHYAHGDFVQAAACWRQVLGIDSSHEQARHFLHLLAAGQPVQVGAAFAPRDGLPLELESGDGGADGLDLLEAPAPRKPIGVPEVTPAPVAMDPARSEADRYMEGARELFGLGDFSGSLQLVQQALNLDPAHAEALDYLERNRDTLIRMYESKVGSTEVRPRVLLRADEIVWLNLDHRAGFVLAQIDGTVSVEDLYALCGLSRLDCARILAELMEQGVISI